MICCRFCISYDDKGWFTQSAAESYQQIWKCDRPWPQVRASLCFSHLLTPSIHTHSLHFTLLHSLHAQTELLVPVNLRPLESSGAIDGMRKTEWLEVFLRSYLLFWPFQISKTSVRFIYDGEYNETSDLSDFLMDLSPYMAHPKRYGNVFVTANNLHRHSSVYNNKGYMRQQLLLMYADKYSSAEYIGLADTDCMFITYVDREDVFENDKPVVHGRIGKPTDFNFWYHIPESTRWLMGGINETMRCMSFFPVTVKRSHFQDLRNYVQSIHPDADSFDDVFRDTFMNHSSTHLLSQFNIICTYLWHFKHNEYNWYIHDTTPDWDMKRVSSGDVDGPVYGAENSRNIYYNNASFTPKPFISIHTRYHFYRSNYLGYVDAAIDGFCTSPPFPKINETEEAFCDKVTAEIKKLGYRKEMHSFEDAMYWKVANERDLINQHRQRYNRIRNCSKYWDPSLLLPFITREADRNQLPYMRELACKQLLVDYNVTYESYKGVYGHTQDSPGDVNKRLWRLYHCDTFDLNSAYKIDALGRNSSYSSVYFFQGACLDCGDTESSLMVTNRSNLFASTPVFSIVAKIQPPTNAFNASGNETFAPTPLPTSPTPSPTVYPTNAPVIMTPAGRLCKAGEHRRGNWVLDPAPIHPPFSCCGWDGYFGFNISIDEKLCLPEGEKAGQCELHRTGGNSSQLLHAGGNACACDLKNRLASPDWKFKDTNNNRAKYIWKPSNCDLLAWNATQFCELLGNRTILMIGDSTMQQTGVSLVNMIISSGASCASRVNVVVSTLLYVTQTYKKCFVDATLQEAHHRIKPDISILNVGAHLKDPGDLHFIIDNFREFMAKEKTERNVTFLWKTQNPGHVNCTNYREPFQDYSLGKDMKKVFHNDPNAIEQTQYNWNLFPTFDDIARNKSYSIGFKVIDMDPLYLRPDAHPAQLPHPDGRRRDCLHFCLPGPLHLFAVLLQTMMFNGEV